MPSLAVRDLRVGYAGAPVLAGVSFEMPTGGILAIIGPSGCGKTTLLRAILGELRAQRGRILVGSHDVTETRVWERGVGIVYQRYALFPHMTVFDNVAYGLRAHGAPKSQIHPRVSQLLRMVRLTHKADQVPDQLSGGERQRVALARALAVEPRILLLDEAFTALDASTRHTVLEEVKALVHELKVTTILVTHDQEEAFLFADRVLVLNKGKMVAFGTAKDVMGNPDPFIQDFVKMAVMHEGTVAADAQGHRFVVLPSGMAIPVSGDGLKDGDAVHVMIKKKPEGESVEVWRRGNR